MAPQDRPHVTRFPSQLKPGDQLAMAGVKTIYVVVTKTQKPQRPEDPWRIFYAPTIGPGETGVRAPKSLRIPIKRIPKDED